MLILKGKYVVASLLMLLTTGVIVGGYVGKTSSKFSIVKASEAIATCEDNADEVVDDVILCDEMSLEDLGISEHYENEEKKLGRLFVSKAEAHISGTMWGRKIDIPNTEGNIKFYQIKNFHVLLA